ncbi:MAG: TetR/AcrR family transcriptional regulator [Paracoccaceae bacterium]
MARPRADDYDDKREAIHRTAARILAEEGGKAPMVRIAQGCGISKGLLYHYYQNRDALIFDIVHTHLSEMDAALAEAGQGLSGAKRLRRLSATLLAHYEDADDLHRLQLGALDTLPPDDIARIRAVERSILDRFRSAIREVEPDIDKPRLTAVSMGLMGMLNWAFTWFRADGPLTRAEFAHIAADMALSQIGAGKTPG